MKLPVMRRKHFAGTNKGNTIVDVPVLSKEDCWKLRRAEKLELLDKYIIRVGGKEESDASSSSDTEAAEDRPLRDWRTLL
eukprot:491070-Lingulodinium_polyedra.AAC.1